MDALREILIRRGVPQVEIEAWVTACTVSLEAAIRDDAVWVNRSAAFDEAVSRIGPALSCDELWDLFAPLFGDPQSFLALAQPEADASENDPQETAEVTRAGAQQPAEPKELVKSAGQWLSSRFGSGPGSDFGSLGAVYNAIATWANTATGPLSQSKFQKQLCDALSQFEPQAHDLTGLDHLLRQPGPSSTTRKFLGKLAVRDSVSRDDLADLTRRAHKDADAAAGKVGRKGHRAWSDALLREVEETCGFTYSAPDGEASRHC